MTTVKFLAGAKDFSLSVHIQIGFGAQPATYPMGIEGTFPKAICPGLTTELHIMLRLRNSGTVHL
jgi:hypothetical protein